MNCKRGGTPELQIEYHREEQDYWFKCIKCGKESAKRWAIKDAEEEWGKANKNFPTCEECANYNYGECDTSHTSTNAAWTCPDHTPKEVIDKILQDYAGSLNRCFELVKEGNDIIKDINGTDTQEEDKKPLESDLEPSRLCYKTEFLKLEKDYFEDVADLKADLKKAEEERHYWYMQWQKVSHENEKLNMLFAKIKEVLE